MSFFNPQKIYSNFGAKFSNFSDYNNPANFSSKSTNLAKNKYKL